MYRRSSYYRSRSAKYSNETVCFNAGVTADTNAGQVLTQQPLTIVPPTNVLGNRKVKNFTIKVTSDLNDDPIIGVLAYVPEGTTMSVPLVTGETQSLYEPNQNVIATFVIPPNCVRNTDQTLGAASNAQSITVSTRLARNLNTGDSIQLALTTPNGLTAGDGTPTQSGQARPPVVICGTVNYSIKY